MDKGGPYNVLTPNTQRMINQSINQAAVNGRVLLLQGLQRLGVRAL